MMKRIQKEVKEEIRVDKNNVLDGMQYE